MKMYLYISRLDCFWTLGLGYVIVIVLSAMNGLSFVESARYEQGERRLEEVGEVKRRLVP